MQKQITQPLLTWYRRHARRLPWRADFGAGNDPYRVWLSEIMLQQTTVATVIPYFDRFLSRWPTVGDLAAAELDAVLHAWQGLGYYARARNLHRCAKVVTADYAGHFPDSEAELKKLPGIGDYTAAAIAAIAFQKPATPVDGNIERIMTRLYRIETPLPQAKADIRTYAKALTPAKHAGDFAQGLMDLGATICTPKQPKCEFCPLKAACQACAADLAAAYPKRLPKKPRPSRYGTVFWLQRPDGCILLRRRPERGLLGGMMEVPSSAWLSDPAQSAEIAKQAPIAACWQPLAGSVRHVFTHFSLELTIWTAFLDNHTSAATASDSRWWPLDRLQEMALPTVMKKVVAHVEQQGRHAALS